MKIDELQQYAIDNGFDSVEFTFTNLRNQVINCKWFDAYFGYFTIENVPGMVSVKQWKDNTRDLFDFTIKPTKP